MNPANHTRTAPRWWEYLRPTNRHEHAPFESDGACWCTKGPTHRVHRSARPLATTPLEERLAAHATAPEGEPTAAEATTEPVPVASPTRKHR